MQLLDESESKAWRVKIDPRILATLNDAARDYANISLYPRGSLKDDVVQLHRKEIAALMAVAYEIGREEVGELVGGDIEHHRLF